MLGVAVKLKEMNHPTEYYLSFGRTLLCCIKDYIGFMSNITCNWIIKLPLYKVYQMQDIKEKCHATYFGILTRHFSFHKNSKKCTSFFLKHSNRAYKYNNCIKTLLLSNEAKYANHT